MKNFEQLEQLLLSQGTKKRIAVVNGADDTTRGAVALALEAGFAEAIFVGARKEVEADESIMRHAPKVSIIDATDADDAAAKAVALAREGKADVIMKGLLNTDNLLRAILNKHTGILPPGEVLSHITVAEIPTYHKLLLFTDVAVIPYPTDRQREAQLAYVLRMARKLGIECPRVALIHCSEKPDPRHFPFTAHYAALKENAANGLYGQCIVDGPLDVKTSCCKAALDKKGIVSPVDGEADAIIFPDIEAGNTFYKTITLFAGATIAGILCGCSVPVVLPSRGDNIRSKYNSLLAASIH